MKYKNIVFDFGNVIGKFDGHYIMEHFCSDENDIQFLSSVIYRSWPELDKGTIDYDEYAASVLTEIPDRLQKAARSFFREWPRYVELFPETERFIRELKEKGASVYLLSNAPTYFAEWTADYPVLRHFDGIVFSAPIKMAKPAPNIYQYLFRTYDLRPKDCFFIDDLEANISAGKALGMNGIVFSGNIDEVKQAICL